jgi:sterol 3beta-glucosyltransferase
LHITIIALGSRGDVQPCVALGEGLQRAGHDVRLAAYGVFRALAQDHGLAFATVGGDVRQALDSPSGQKWLESGRSVLRFILGMRKLTTFEGLRQSLDDCVDACRGTEAILYSPLGAAGYHVAEKMSVPSIYVPLQPASRSRAAPSIFAPALPLGGLYNWSTNLFIEQLIWQTARIPFNRWRRETLGLSALPLSGPFGKIYRDRQPFVYGYSQHVCPRPADWPAWHHITGYWFLQREPGWFPPPKLEAFLGAGPKPVCIGFGSMSGALTRRLAKLAVAATAAAGLRCVLLGGWAETEDSDLPEDVIQLESAPHGWLFPRMAAVVHHGGAGTTAAGLRAGVPSILVPFFGDQPFWARRVYALGVGPRPVMRSRLTVERLSQALSEATMDEGMRDRAGELGERIRAEDGVAKAVDIIHRYLSSA